MTRAFSSASITAAPLSSDGALGAVDDRQNGRLDRLLRTAMRIIRRANRRLVAAREVPEEIPRELIPYSID
ncbi:hypothetical protein [Streptomyces griseoviridis]|uniref:hypothetical protein n=1 Tax=Streptomyces griseoviridis TaxID=45398 RepID=UPI0033C6D2A0